ncbi:MAG: hypothetical protein ACLFVE_15255 [Chitinispirillaceae bacterium]
MNRETLKCFSLFLFILITSCSNQNSVAGGGTDFPNTRTVAGVVLTGQGTAAENTLVTAYDTDHNPLCDSDEVHSAVTDSNGTFLLSLPDDREFNLIAKNPDGTGFFGKKFESSIADTIQLEKSGCALVVVRSAAAHSVYVRGCPFSSPVVSGVARFDTLPAGMLPQILTDQNTVISDTLAVTSDETSTVADVLLLSGQSRDSLSTADKELIGEMRNIGLRISTADRHTFDTNGVDLICISSTADSLPSFLTQTDKPILNFNPFMQNELFMTGAAQHSDYGFEENYFVISIRNDTHPAGSGLPGTLRLYDSPVSIDWGNPAGEAEVIATLPGIDSQAVVYCHDRGSRMSGTETAPSKRGFFPLRQNNTEYLSRDGWRIVRRMTAWAVTETTP